MLSPRVVAAAGSARPRLGYALGAAALASVILLGLGAQFLPTELAQDFWRFLEAVRASAWAPLPAIAAFALLASAGVPLVVLITALVAAFGPLPGLCYSWISEMIACSIGFGIGRRFGARLLARHTEGRVADFMQHLARRGILFSALVRLVPSVPAALVNIAAGATPIRFRDFLAGTSIGIVPKMALLAFGGHAVMAALRTNTDWAWPALIATILAWVALALVARYWLARTRPAQANGSLIT